VNDQIRTRKAPLGMRLPVPRHVQLASALMGIGTLVLGVSYAVIPVYRRPEVADRSVVAAIEHPLGWCMAVVGVWVLVSTALGHSRASAHTVAAVAQLVYLGAVVWTIALTYPFTPPQAGALALFGFIAHGGAALDYWKRGYR
jgi:hypothetical protein